MTKKRVITILITALVILSVLAWGPMFWSHENMFASGNPFIRQWSQVALYLYIPWVVTLLLSTIFVFMSVRNGWVRIAIVGVMLPVSLFLVSIGPLIHVCSLGVDCI